MYAALSMIFRTIKRVLKTLNVNKYCFLRAFFPAICLHYWKQWMETGGPILFRPPSLFFLCPFTRCRSDVSPPAGELSFLLELAGGTGAFTFTDTYCTMSAKAVSRGLDWYSMPCFAHRDFTKGVTLWKLCRGMVGKRLWREGERQLPDLMASSEL